MIEFISLKLAQGIKRSIPEHPISVNVMRFSLSIIINAFMIILLTLAVSLFTGNTRGAVIALIAFPLLRQVSGGFHLKTGMMCVLVSSAMLTAISFFNVERSYVLFLNMASLLLVAIFAPSRIEKQSRIPKSFYPQLKIISCLIVLVNFIVASPVIAATFFIQGISLVSSLKGGEQ
ncbi:accessory gene regulator ArgB-like protein [Paenibacillus rhizophilus]|uniref:Accessory regulator AgrB n=1 Tax=Paenibacillus rhizophilus TaxID=1850366 RepID=A0A3N9Q663_9BACL|nr:accessory gene regulator B family protein [Paenibacillus rhizophilus]RQW12986.1 accessory regulator AgrB [Paenibacillus rhizophilus]